ncbi:MAG: multidrug ABC transporter ATP-binding protein, partial [Arenimonas sp.]
MAPIDPIRIILVENKQVLMQKLGKKQLTLNLEQPLTEIPAALAGLGLTLSADGRDLIYTYDTRSEALDMIGFMRRVADAGIRFKDLQT